MSASLTHHHHQHHQYHNQSGHQHHHLKLNLPYHVAQTTFVESLCLGLAGIFDVSLFGLLFVTLMMFCCLCLRLSLYSEVNVKKSNNVAIPSNSGGSIDRAWCASRSLVLHGGVCAVRQFSCSVIRNIMRRWLAKVSELSKSSILLCVGVSVCAVFFDMNEQYIAGMGTRVVYLFCR